MTDLSNLDPIQFALLKRVSDSPGQGRGELRHALELSKYKFNQLVAQLESQGLITYQDGRPGRAHRFRLGSRVTRKQVEKEQHRRDKLAVDPKARAALVAILRSLRDLVQQLDQLLTEE